MPTAKRIKNLKETDRVTYIKIIIRFNEKDKTQYDSETLNIHIDYVGKENILEIKKDTIYKI